MEVIGHVSEPEWNALSLQEKKDKEHFLKNEEHVGKGFMAMVHNTMYLCFMLLGCLSHK